MRFMPSQINTKSCPERISFAPLRHGRDTLTEIHLYPRRMRKNWISKHEEDLGSLFFAYPKIRCAHFTLSRVKNVFDVGMTLTRQSFITDYNSFIRVFYVKAKNMFHYLFI